MHVPKEQKELGCTCAKAGLPLSPVRNTRNFGIQVTKGQRAHKDSEFVSWKAWRAHSLLSCCCSCRVPQVSPIPGPTRLDNTHQSFKG